jgi:pimeloyl-ACP methyl ester carboxylesterase
MRLTRRDVIAAAVSPIMLPSSVESQPMPTQPTQVQPFAVAIDEAVLARIAARVGDAHLPRTAAGAGWSYGVDARWFAALIGYWRDGYDWRVQERAINALPQFTATVKGRRLHFVHLRSRNPGARPLLLLHGWPYSFYSFAEVIEPLARDFHVVVPSLPGFAFSQAPADSPQGLRVISGHLHALMAEGLGYDRYLVQGSDHGAVAADWLALDHPDAVLGEQTNLVAFRHKGAEYASGNTGVARPTSEEQRFVAQEQETFKRESAYFELQRTRPETIAYAMADSPVGMAAYILDKWQKWTDTRKRSLDQIYGRDRLLTEVMLYLVSDSFATSLWPYAGFALEPFSIPEGRKIDVPFGFSGYPDPLNAPPPRAFVEHGRSRIMQWEVGETGGHFPFLEDPGRFVASFRSFAARV